MSFPHPSDAGPTERSDAQPLTVPETSGSGPSVALPTGTRLREEYRIEGVIDTGSVTITYRAHDEHLDSSVAVREYYPRHLADRPPSSTELHLHSDQDPEAFAFGLQQFRQEGRTLARFEHPNVVDVRSYFEENGTGYLVMDAYEGHTLAEGLRETGGRCSQAKALSLIRDVLRGLHVVHRAGTLHFAIDPHHIYLPSEKTAVLINFGAARRAIGTRSQSLSVLRSHGYAPIEQYPAGGEHQGPPADLYACAAVLYRCLTGVSPPVATHRVQADSLVPPREIREEISAETSTAIMKGLRLNPEQRPASVEAFAALLNDGAPSSGVHEGVSPHPTDEPLSSPTDSRPSPSSAAPAWKSDDDPAHEDAFPRFSIAGTAVAIIGTIGGTLLVSETHPTEVLAFFVTWISICTGLVWLFREGENLMSGESRAAVSDWLLRENFAKRKSNWPDTFTSLFDAVFTKQHLSWTCFVRSALTSTLVITMLLGIFVGVGILSLPPPDQALLVGLILVIPVAMNVVIDYASLFETRWALGRMSASNNSLLHAGYLAVDLVLTFLCILVPFFGMQFLGIKIIAGHSVGSALFWQQLFGALENAVELFFLFGHEEFGGLPDVMSIMLFSTLFTSVWAWLYVGTGLLLRVVHPIFESLDVLKHHFDVHARPVHTMGMMLAVLTSLGFAISAPFVL